MTKTLQEILMLDGIIIRNIKKGKQKKYWRSSEAMHEEHKKKGGKVETRINKKGDKIEFMVDEYENSLGGKFLITFDYGQDTTIKFYKGNYGIGNTIEEAYEDYIK